MPDRDQRHPPSLSPLAKRLLLLSPSSPLVSSASTSRRTLTKQVDSFSSRQRDKLPSSSRFPSGGSSSAVLLSLTWPTSQIGLLQQRLPSSPAATTRTTAFNGAHEQQRRRPICHRGRRQEQRAEKPPGEPPNTPQQICD